MEEADIVINFAAESHVDRSIHDPEAFITTDVIGVYTLVEAAKKYGVEKFIQISTDEVYGDVPEGFSVETDPVSPNSPYSATKTGGELLARAVLSHVWGAGDRHARLQHLRPLSAAREAVLCL